MTAIPANWLGTTLHLFCQQVFSIKYIMYCLCSSVLTLKKDIRHIKIQLRKFGCNMETVSSCRLQNSSFEVREEWRPRLRTLTVTGYAVYSTDILLQHAMAQWPFHSPFTQDNLNEPDMIKPILRHSAHRPEWSVRRNPVQFPGRPVDFVFGFQGCMLWD